MTPAEALAALGFPAGIDSVADLGTYDKTEGSIQLTERQYEVTSGGQSWGVIVRSLPGQ